MNARRRFHEKWNSEEMKLLNDQSLTLSNPCLFEQISYGNYSRKLARDYETAAQYHTYINSYQSNNHEFGKPFEANSKFLPTPVNGMQIGSSQWENLENYFSCYQNINFPHPIDSKSFWSAGHRDQSAIWYQNCYPITNKYQEWYSPFLHDDCPSSSYQSHTTPNLG